MQNSIFWGSIADKHFLFLLFQAIFPCNIMPSNHIDILVSKEFFNE